MVSSPITTAQPKPNPSALQRCCPDSVNGFYWDGVVCSSVTGGNTGRSTGIKLLGGGFQTAGSRDANEWRTLSGKPVNFYHIPTITNGFGLGEEAVSCIHLASGTSLWTIFKMLLVQPGITTPSYVLPRFLKV